MNELLSHVCACLAFIEKYLQLVGSGALFQAVFEAWFGNFSNMLAIATFYASCICVSAYVCVQVKPSRSGCLRLWSLVSAICSHLIGKPDEAETTQGYDESGSQAPTCHTPSPLLCTHLAITAICPCDLYSITCQSFTNCCVELPFPSSHKSLFNGASNFLFSSSPSLSFSHCLTAAPYAAWNHNNNLFTRWTIYLFIFIPFGRRLICFLDLPLPAAEQKIQKSKTRSTKHKK